MAKFYVKLLPDSPPHRPLFHWALGLGGGALSVLRHVLWLICTTSIGEQGHMQFKD